MARQDAATYRQWDLKEDCAVDGLDVAKLLAEWGECAGCGGGESLSRGGGMYEQFMEWLKHEDWDAFLEWHAGHK